MQMHLAVYTSIHQYINTVKQNQGTAMMANLNEQDAEIPFAEPLSFAIWSGILRPQEHCARDWLRLMSADDLNRLCNRLEIAFREPCNVSPDIVEVLIHLVFLETRRRAVAMDDLFDLMEALLMICRIEIFVQQGYIKVYGRWSITDPNNTEHYASLTEKGYEAASKPGAPLFLQRLKQKTGSGNWN